MDKASKQYTAFTMRNLGFFGMQIMSLGLCNVPAMFQRLRQNCLGELKLDILLNLFGPHDSLLKDRGGALAMLALLCSIASGNTT